MKYLVTLKRTEIYIAEVEVEADDEEQAEEKALDAVTPDDWRNATKDTLDNVEMTDVEETD